MSAARRAASNRWSRAITAKQRIEDRLLGRIDSKKKLGVTLMTEHGGEGKLLTNAKSLNGRRDGIRTFKPDDWSRSTQQVFEAWSEAKKVGPNQARSIVRQMVRVRNENGLKALLEEISNPRKVFPKEFVRLVKEEAGLR